MQLPTAASMCKQAAASHGKQVAVRTRGIAVGGPHAVAQPADAAAGCGGAIPGKHVQGAI